MRILNQLGAAASVEIANRLATHVVETRLATGVKASNVLTTVSIDNMDILQPYGFVSCLNASRSWHGTSVQPLPVTPTQ